MPEHTISYGARHRCVGLASPKAPHIDRSNPESIPESHAGRITLRWHPAVSSK